MKQIFTLIFALFALGAFGQPMTAGEWDEQAKTNIRLLPRYGPGQKTEHQQQLDAQFIRETMQQEAFKGDRTAASRHLIGLGFSKLSEGDVKVAMYRFNQAYLLDTANTDIHWGYGAVYMALGDYDRAKGQYEEGLSRNPANTHLLTDLGTYYLGQYYGIKPVDEAMARPHLDTALMYLAKSYALDAKDENTAFKLSICYWNRGDCGNAWKYYDACRALGGAPITEAYTRDLGKKCKRKK